MKISEVVRLLDAEILCGEEFLEDEVFSACGSDLMSDVLAYVKTQGLLLTGLNNLQVIRTADMMDMHAVVFVRGKCPDDETVALARRKDMVILKTMLPLYSSCGILYHNGLGR
jgi:predicted transcriptional regulator